MSNNPADQTIVGSYRTVQIDGEDVVLHRVGNRWVTTQERLELERTREFMERFKGTDFIPGTEVVRPEANVERRPSDSAIKLQGTSCRLEAFLVEMLGDPALIATGDPTALAAVRRVRANEGLLRHALGLIAVYGDQRWHPVRDALVAP